MSAVAETAASIALETDGLAVAYGRTRVLDGITLAVPRGSVFALLGRNGSGKTSLLRCLLGQRPVAAGRARVLGDDPWRQRRRLMELAVRFGSVVGPETFVVDLAEGRVLETLPGLYPLRDFWWLGGPEASATTVHFFVSSKDGAVVRRDFATGEQRVVAGPGTLAGERLTSYHQATPTVRPRRVPGPGS